MQRINKRIENISSLRNQLVSQHIKFDEKECIIYGSEKNNIYRPTNTGSIAHNDNSFIRLIMGPYGSGKSTWCCHEIVRRTCGMPRWKNDRRRARWAIVRNTSGELYSTTLKTWLTWFSDLGDISKRQKPLLTYEHTFNDGNGIVELELIFIALDKEQDLRKIKSLEVTGCYINELSEVPQGTLSHFKGRVNHRYPSRAFCNEYYWSGIIADTNPPDIDHWIYRDFEDRSLEGYRLFKQPPGLIKDENDNWKHNPDCDNFENLDKTYYVNQSIGQSEDFIKVYCLGEWGSVGDGKRVYTEYNDAIHTIDKIHAIQGSPIHVGWDFGLTPCCIVIQISPRGQIRILKEYTSEDMGIRTFAKNIVIPHIEIDFPYNKIGISRADPAGMSRDDIMEDLSCIGELCSLGIDTSPARSNEIATRIASVKYYLNTMVDGQPSIILSREGCPQLRRGFIKDYCFKRIRVSGEERYKETPHKNFSSHSHDALQYIVMEFAADSILSRKSIVNKQDMFNPVLRIF